MESVQPQPKTKKKTELQALREQNLALTAEVTEKQQKIELLEKENASLKHKAEAFDDLMASQSLFPIGVIAKNYGRTAIWLNQYLQQKKVQYNRGDLWMLYAKYDSCGYTRVCWYNYAEDSKGRALSRPHTYWTGKGMAFIRDLLIADGLWNE